MNKTKRYFARTWTVTSETVKQLSEVAKALGEDNLSAALRYSIRFTYKHFQKRNEEPNRNED